VFVRERHQDAFFEASQERCVELPRDIGSSQHEHLAGKVMYVRIKKR
jgi:hypothetical protein